MSFPPTGRPAASPLPPAFLPPPRTRASVSSGDGGPCTGDSQESGLSAPLPSQAVGWNFPESENWSICCFPAPSEPIRSGQILLSLMDPLKQIQINKQEALNNWLLLLKANCYQYESSIDLFHYVSLNCLWGSAKSLTLSFPAVFRATLPSLSTEFYDQHNTSTPTV